jgi:hypothetical protein
VGDIETWRRFSADSFGVKNSRLILGDTSGISGRERQEIVLKRRE